MNVEVARGAVGEAVDALLLALVALDGLEAVEVPVEALDLALRSDDAHREARVAFHAVLRELREVVGTDLLLRVEERANAVVVAATDVAFRLGARVKP